MDSNLTSKSPDRLTPGSLIGLWILAAVGAGVGVFLIANGLRQIRDLSDISLLAHVLGGIACVALPMAVALVHGGKIVRWPGATASSIALMLFASAAGLHLAFADGPARGATRIVIALIAVGVVMVAVAVYARISRRSFVDVFPKAARLGA